MRSAQEYGMTRDANPVDALDSFFENGLISDVLYLVKAGKEAVVYCCEAAEETGAELLAGKAYYARDHRNFRDDSVYREGRVIVTGQVRRAVEKKTGFGRRFAFGSWVQHEYETLKLLHAAGADVPRPVAVADGAILMEYVGDDGGPAQPLNRVRLAPDEGLRLFERLLWNVELLLANNCVHGDLSPFNVLVRDGGLKIIDFPQTVDARTNPNARALLERDVANLWRYFARDGSDGGTDPERLVADLWRRFVRGDL
jgi:RIO kinase 1